MSGSLSSKLVQAIQEKDAIEAEQLLASGAYDDEVNLQIDEWMTFLLPTPLWIAVVNRDVLCAKMLLEKKADVDRTVQKCGHVTKAYYASVTESPLARAVAQNDVAMVELLIQYGANPDIVCTEMEFNGHDIDGGIDTGTYVASERCRSNGRLKAIVDEYCRTRTAALQDYMVPLGMLTDDDEEQSSDGGIFLTRRLAEELLTNLIKAGQNCLTREAVFSEWGFLDAREAEVALKSALCKDESGKLQSMMDTWHMILMR